MPKNSSCRIQVIDSHTAGEPTRVIVGGVVVPKGKSMKEKRATFAREFDWLRTAAVCEPRGHNALVGALLCEPCEPNCVAGVIFFNNVGLLHGCLHGTMGLVVTLQHLGWLDYGTHRIDTPTGVVTVELAADGATVTVCNVRSYRKESGLEIDVPGHGIVRGDVAWGGNWFFLAEAPEDIPVEESRIEELTDFAWSIRKQLKETGVTGTDGEEVDHIEIFGPPLDSDTADSKNFVLCPGGAYDRSPCGTGTSAKLSCLAADGKLAPGQIWRQSGILDSVFLGTIEMAPNGEGVLPTVMGSAYVTSEADLILNPIDPFVTTDSENTQHAPLSDQTLNQVFS